MKNKTAPQWLAPSSLSTAGVREALSLRNMLGQRLNEQQALLAAAQLRSLPTLYGRDIKPHVSSIEAGREGVRGNRYGDLTLSSL